jgi:rhodanese-related sulfurtransferase
MSSLRKSQSTIRVPSPFFDIPLPEFDDCVHQKGKSPTAFRPSGLAHEPLPIVPHEGRVPYITSDTMHRLLSGEYCHHFNEIYVVDCRFAYEFDGGHILNAMNINNPSLLKDRFFHTILSKAAIIFHCEFSQCRGPEMAAFFRKLDRKMNESSYPKLHYPNVYILQGGFSEFWRLNSADVEGTYVRMLDEAARATGELVAANAAFKENFQRAKDGLESDTVGRHAIDPSVLSPKRLWRRRITTT